MPTAITKNPREARLKNYERKRDARCRSGPGSTTLRGRTDSRDIHL